MRTASPLPAELMDRVFTLSQAKDLGVPANRLRAGDVHLLHRRLYFQGSGTPSEAAVAAGLCLIHDGSFASHLTAGRIHGLWLPRRLQSGGPLHLTRYRSRPLEITGVACHRIRQFKGGTTTIPAPSDGPPHSILPISTPARTWLELAQTLRQDDLVAIGDQLVRQPYTHFEARREPLATREQLLLLLDRYRGFPGSGNARAALELVRVGSDSAMETKLRLALIRAGLPEPELQIRAEPDDPFSASCDLGYRSARLAIQYDGAHHRTAEQLRVDNRRDRAFTAGGWNYIKLDWSDASNGFSRAIAVVRQGLASAA
ncbi:hypothetical protein [Arthrobacter sp. KK5.5]|uniref:hypothetical protein n=1 Tax=Arthrobacter sp. KK5.5 TaxID=3373084 RepID=UPI003EE68140